MADTYGVDIDTYGDDKDLFSKITGQMKTATMKSTYAPFFEINQQKAESSFLDKLFSGNANSTFAGSRADEAKEEGAEGDLGMSMLKLNENVAQKIASSQGVIDRIIAENRQTAFQLDQIEADEEEKDYWGDQPGWG